MKTTIQILFLLLIAAACRKPDNQDVVTIEGQLMAGCNTPAANKSGFILESSSLLGGPGVSLDFTTDENGYFKVTHTGKGNLSSFMVRVQGSSDVLKVSGLADRSKDLGKVFINPPTVNYYLRLEVNNNSYTELDTLHYRNAGYPSNGLDPWLKKAGPFNDNVIDTVHNAINPGVFPLSFGSSIIPKMRLDYFINVYDSWNDKYVYIPTPHCVDEYQTVTLVID